MPLGLGHRELVPFYSRGQRVRQPCLHGYLTLQESKFKEKKMENTVRVEKIQLRNTFWKYVTLNILSMIGMSCFIFVDTLCIANGVGNNGLTALNLVLPVYAVVNGTGLMLGIGAASRYSMARGKGEYEAADRAFSQAVNMAVIAGIFYMLAGGIFTSSIGRALGADDSVIRELVPYMRTLMLFSPAFLINNVLVCFVRNDGSPQLSMAAMMSGNLSNIVLDILFVFGFGWGMFGAAFATGLSPIISMCVLSIYFVRKKNHFRYRRSRLQIKELTGIILLGGASFVTEVSAGIVILLFNFVILDIGGNTGVAAYGVIANIALIVAAIFTGIAQGIQPLVSRKYGEGKYQELGYIRTHGLILALLLGTVCCAGGILGRDLLIQVFNHSGDYGFWQTARGGIEIYFLAFVPMGINVVASALCAAKGQPGPSLLIAMLRGVVLDIILVMIFPHLWGMEGVWAVVPAAELLTVPASIWFAAGRKRAVRQTRDAS